MKKKEIEVLITDENRKEELFNVVTDHFRQISNICRERCVEWIYGYNPINPFDGYYTLANIEIDGEYVHAIFQDIDREWKEEYVFKIKDLYDFDYCKYGKLLVNEAIKREKKHIELYKKEIQKSTDRIKELKHHIKGEC